jgi:hypothetical protein
VRHELAALDADRHMGNRGRSGCVLWPDRGRLDDDMKIDETIWPLPTAFNIRAGSPFGRSEAYRKEQQLAAKNQRSGIKAAAKVNDPQKKRKTK